MRWRNPDRWQTISTVLQVSSAVSIACFLLLERNAVAGGIGAVAAPILLLLQWVENRLRSRQKREEKDLCHRITQRVLEHIRDEFFRDLLEQGKITDLRKHRVTLLTYNADPRSRKTWLAVEARVGSPEISSTIWNIDPNSVEPSGIAGRIWHNAMPELRAAACDWPSEDDWDAKQRYAESLGITLEQCEELNVKSRYFAGAIVIDGHNQFGVLMIDSTEPWWPESKSHQTRIKKRLRRMADLLGSVLMENQT